MQSTMERVDRDHSAILFKGAIGNKPFPLETMLRIHMLQNLYDLSCMCAVLIYTTRREFHCSI